MGAQRGRSFSCLLAFFWQIKVNRIPRNVGRNPMCDVKIYLVSSTLQCWNYLIAISWSTSSNRVPTRFGESYMSWQIAHLACITYVMLVWGVFSHRLKVDFERNIELNITRWQNYYLTFLNTCLEAVLYPLFHLHFIQWSC